jgi:hypothetical protein
MEAVRRKLIEKKSLMVWQAGHGLSEGAAVVGSAFSDQSTLIDS